MAQPPTGTAGTLQAAPLLPGAAELIAIAYRTQWRAFDLTPPERLLDASGGVYPPMSLETAVTQIIAGLGSKTPPKDFARLKEPSLYALNVARFALAQLLRGELLDPVPESVSEWTDALARTLEADPDLKRLPIEYATSDGERSDYLDLPIFRAEPFLTSVRDAPRDPTTRFFRAFSVPELQLLNGRNSPPRELRNYRFSRSYQQGVADTTASVEVNRPAAGFENVLDPRQWGTNLPTLWPAAMFIAPEPFDRDDDGNQNQLGGTKAVDEVFYEEAVFGWEALPITRYRNLLRVTLDFGNKSSLRFSYRQESCLTSEFFGSAAEPGGIDVDFGFGTCTDLLLSPGWCRLEARKASRFDLPKHPLLNKLYNDVAAVSLPLLIEMFVLIGALMSP